MNDAVPGITSEEHKRIGIALFNYTWSMIEKPDKSDSDTEHMINSAHASLFHWSFSAEPVHFARGEWLISRVYSIAKRPEPAMFHGQKSLKICLENGVSKFDRGFAFEAVARAYAVMGRDKERDENLELGLEEAQQVENDADRKWLIDNLRSVTSLDVPL